MDRDYNCEFHEEMDRVIQSGKRPRLFLHACCGPCLCHPISLLLPYFDLTVGYINPNIRPLSEYEKRNRAIQSFLYRYAMDHGREVSFVLVEEDFPLYDKIMVGREQDHEGGQSCLKCHAHRLFLSYKYAYEHHFDYFTTVMTVSCKKPSKELNEIAMALSRRFPGTKYLYSDFKKEDGQLKGIRIGKKYQVYRQNYCGCLPSLRERIEYEKRKASRPSLSSR